MLMNYLSFITRRELMFTLSHLINHIKFNYYIYILKIHEYIYIYTHIIRKTNVQMYIVLTFDFCKLNANDYALSWKFN